LTTKPLEDREHTVYNGTKLFKIAVFELDFSNFFLSWATFLVTSFMLLSWNCPEPSNELLLTKQFSILLNKLLLISSINIPVTAEIQDENTEKVLDDPNAWALLKKAQEHSKETKFDENNQKVEDKVKEKNNDNAEKNLDDPNAWASLKKAQELVKKYEDCEIKYYCKICPDFSTICESALIEHHCSFHVNEDSNKTTK
jgi:hypothetical protein